MSKRSHAEMDDKAPTNTSSSPFMPMFEQFRAELDEHHDRRERIIKASRDITAASKKIIFTLQRIRKLREPLPPHVNKANKQYYDTIQTQFASVSKDLQGLNAWRYARQISGGCQEYMEAASFEHYLTNATLISHEDAVSQLLKLDPEGPGVHMSAEDYLLGIYDMTGELMRFAITTMATSGSLPGIEAEGSEGQRNVLNDLRAIRTALEGIDAGNGPFAKEVGKKAEVMRQSVEKVEKSLYGLTVRGAERPKGWMPDAGSGRPVEVES